MLELLFLLLLLNVPLLKVFSIPGGTDPIGEIINAIKNGIKSIVETVFGSLGEWLNEYVFQPLGEGVSDTISSVFGTLTTYIQALAAPFHGVYNAAWQVWSGTGSYIAQNYGPLGPVVFVTIIALIFAIGFIFVKRLPTAGW